MINNSYTSGHSPTVSPATRMAARSISFLFSPLLVPAYCTWMTMWGTTLSWLPDRIRWIAVLYTFLFTGIIPFGLIAVMRFCGQASDLDLTDRRQRIIPYAAGTLCYAAACIYFHKAHAPEWFYMFFAGAGASILVSLLISLRWKISAHGAAMGGWMAMMLRTIHHGRSGIVCISLHSHIHRSGMHVAAHPRSPHTDATACRTNQRIRMRLDLHIHRNPILKFITGLHKNMETKPLVSIIMGSTSDLPILEKAAKFLDQLEVPFEMNALSAHRTPAEVEQFARSAEERGLKVIIAAAGMAAALPGVIAAMTPLPVIGIPISSTLDGRDALLSIVQMPPGVAVATVGIDAGLNAAVLAVQMIALSDPALAARYAEYRASLSSKIVKANEDLRKVTYKYKTN